MAATTLTTTSPQTLIVALILVGLMEVSNAGWMLAAPEHWYWSIPGVPNTGPFNEHFVRDIGLVFLTLGAAHLWAAAHKAYRVPLTAIGAGWLAAHGLYHVIDIARGCLPPVHWWTDGVTVFLPALLATSLAVITYLQSDRGDPE